MSVLLKKYNKNYENTKNNLFTDALGRGSFTEHTDYIWLKHCNKKTNL